MADVRLIDANALPNYKCQVTATIGDRKGPAEMRFVFWLSPYCPWCGQPMDAKDMDVPTMDGGATDGV